ncbi:hypothetical protein UA18_00002 [Burkholderia multivorans]|uniref:Uncharacterized protein n=1 Tax=Burkholderia multivorans TaxID=87883 RepID=A0ABD7LEL8_9BURK|nr:hypothetical protein UA18_00002 [Burkholderia multivorans]
MTIPLQSRSRRRERSRAACAACSCRITCSTFCASAFASMPGDAYTLIVIGAGADAGARAAVAAISGRPVVDGKRCRCPRLRSREADALRRRRRCACRVRRTVAERSVLGVAQPLLEAGHREAAECGEHAARRVDAEPLLEPADNAVASALDRGLHGAQAVSDPVDEPGHKVRSELSRSASTPSARPRMMSASQAAEGSAGARCGVEAFLACVDGRQ